MASTPTLAAAPPDRPAAGYAPALAALVGGAVAMGVSPVLVRLVGGEVGPFASAFWRVLLALPVLYAWARIEARGRPVALAPGARRAAVLAGLAFVGDLFFWHLAIRDTTVANATFFATTAPVFIVVIAFLAFGQRTARTTLAGLALCLAGGAALIGQTLRVSPAHLVGDLEGLATAVFFAVYFLCVERARAGGYGAGRLTFVASVVCAAGLGLVALVFETRPLLPATRAGVGLLLALALISHAGGQGLLAVALGRLPSAFSSLVIFLEAIAAALIAWVVLGESLGGLQFVGGALILGGIYVARPRKARR